MADCSARVRFVVTYRAKDSEVVTAERAEALAETMLAVLRGSPKVRAIQIECEGVEDVERLD